MEVEASRIVKKLKTSKRVNHKGETILHLLAIKVKSCLRVMYTS